MSALTAEAKGVFVIAVTPFQPDGRIDMESCDRMVDFYLDVGATGLTVLGMMGEAPKLTVEESQEVVARILERVDGRVPVVVGVSAPGFAQIDTLTRAVMELGAAGVMVAPPGSLRTDDQIVNYYRQVAEVLGDVPFVLQDFPLVTGVQIASKVIGRIVNELPTCVCNMRIGRGSRKSPPCGLRACWSARCRSFAATAGYSCPRRWAAVPMAR